MWILESWWFRIVLIAVIIGAIVYVKIIRPRQ